MGILVDKRTKSAPKVQEVLTKYGDSILSRIGIHDPGEKEHGLITLNLRDKEEQLEALTQELEHLDGVTVKTVYMK
jgi:putative iron-only hydrogenase system regulator